MMAVFYSTGPVTITVGLPVNDDGKRERVEIGASGPITLEMTVSGTESPTVEPEPVPGESVPHEPQPTTSPGAA